MPDPRHVTSPVDVLHDHGERLFREETKPSAKANLRVPRSLADLTDVLLKYKSQEGEEPQLGQVLGYRFAQSSKFPHEGKWQAVGGAMVAPEPITASGTGDLTIAQALIDPDDWPAGQQWIVTATATLSGTFDSPPDAPDISVTIPPGTTATNVEHDSVTDTLTFTDGFTFDVPAASFGIFQPLPTGGIRLIPEGGPTVDDPELASQVLRADTSGVMSGTVGWVFAGGTPYVEAGVAINSTDWPGSHTLTVIARCWPIP